MKELFLFFGFLFAVWACKNIIIPVRNPKKTLWHFKRDREGNLHRVWSEKRSHTSHEPLQLTRF